MAGQIKNTAHEYEKKYMPYAIFDGNEIVGFEPDTPFEALKAVIDHIKMSQYFDDSSNYDYWDDLIIKLGLDKVPYKGRGGD